MTGSQVKLPIYTNEYYLSNPIYLRYASYSVKQTTSRKVSFEYYDGTKNPKIGFNGFDINYIFVKKNIDMVR